MTISIQNKTILKLKEIYDNNDAYARITIDDILRVIFDTDMNGLIQELEKGDTLLK